MTEALRGLIEQWRERATGLLETGFYARDDASYAVENCADELEAALAALPSLQPSDEAKDLARRLRLDASGEAGRMSVTAMYRAADLLVSLGSPVREDAPLLQIAGLVNGYFNGGAIVSAEDTLRAIAESLGKPMTVREDAPRPPLPRREDWQPIATLPTDYPEGFLVFWRTAIGEPGAEMVGSRTEYDEILAMGEVPATHWMPLPAAPSASPDAPQLPRRKDGTG